MGRKCRPEKNEAEAIQAIIRNANAAKAARRKRKFIIDERKSKSARGMRLQGSNLRTSTAMFKVLSRGMRSEPESPKGTKSSGCKRVPHAAKGSSPPISFPTSSNNVDHEDADNIYVKKSGGLRLEVHTQLVDSMLTECRSPTQTLISSSSSDAVPIIEGSPAMRDKHHHSKNPSQEKIAPSPEKVRALNPVPKELCQEQDMHGVNDTTESISLGEEGSIRVEEGLEDHSKATNGNLRVGHGATDFCPIADWEDVLGAKVQHIKLRIKKHSIGASHLKQKSLDDIDVKLHSQKEMKKRKRGRTKMTVEEEKKKRCGLSKKTIEERMKQSNKRTEPVMEEEDKSADIPRIVKQLLDHDEVMERNNPPSTVTIEGNSPSNTVTRELCTSEQLNIMREKASVKAEERAVGASLTNGSSSNEKEPSNETELPFTKKSLMWESAELMEVCGTMPQQPHFTPLEHYDADFREGMAIGLIVTFANLVADIKKLGIVNCEDICFEKLKSLAPLEANGFDVQCVRSRLERLLKIQRNLSQCKGKQVALREKILEANDEKARLDALIASEAKVIREVEEKLTHHQERRTSLLFEKESKDLEIAKLKIDLQVAEGAYSSEEVNLNAAMAAPLSQ